MHLLITKNYKKKVPGIIQMVEIYYLMIKNAYPFLLEKQVLVAALIMFVLEIDQYFVNFTHHLFRIPHLLIYIHHQRILVLQLKIRILILFTQTKDIKIKFTPVILIKETLIILILI